MPTVSERLLEALLENAIDYAIIAIDLHGHITSWSEGARLILGWTAEEMLGRPVATFFTEEDCARGVPAAEMEAALAHGRGNDERWHLRRDGSRFWASGEMMPLRDTGGQVHGLVKILRDRTAQRLADERQRADAEFLRNVLAASQDCIKVLDLGGRIQFINEGGLKALEITDTSQVYGLYWPDRWKSGANADARAALVAARAGGVGRFLGQAETFAGNPRHWDVQVTPMPDAQGRPERLLVVSRDVTEAHHAEQRFKLSEERLQLALSAAGTIGIWDADLVSGTVHGDATFARLHGIPGAQADAGVALEGIFAHIPDEDVAGMCTQLAALIAGENALHLEYRVTQADATFRWVAAHGRLVRDASGTPARLTGAMVDVTERRESEQRLHLLMEELAHRVKNTLSVVQSIAAQTLRGGGDMAVAREAFTARLMALSTAHDILMQGNWAQAGLRSLVEGAARLYAPNSAEGARLRADGPDVTLGPRAALAFAMVLHEMGTNAVKYGALSVVNGHVSVRWHVDGATLCFTWSELGGPIVSPPTHRGFGSRLIARSLAAELGAVVVHEFAASGVVLRLEAPLVRLEE